MGKEESSQLPRRTTRYSILASSSNNDTEPKKTSINHKPTVNDLTHVDEPLSLDDLFSSFPGRKSKISEILCLLGPLNSPMLPLFVYGGASTGKTSIVLQVFRHLRRPFVYSSCITCHSPRILFESILNQLVLHRKNEDNSYSSARRCDKPSDFTNFLREALSDNILEKLKGDSGKLDSKKLGMQDKGSMIYLIIDNFELVREWDKSSSILPFLLGLYGTLKIPEVGIIFISRSSPDTYYSGSGFPEPIPVRFPDYTEKDLRQIFLLHQDNAELYTSFLDIVLMPFCRISRRVDELSAAFSPLFKKYCEPLSDVNTSFVGQTKQKKEETKRKLYSHIKQQISSSLNEFFRISSVTTAENSKNPKGKGSVRKIGSNETSEQVDFHMPTSAKYLLISAFLASRNPATLDASFFDSTGGLDNHKRKRKVSEKTMDQKETAEQESLMKGPGTFPLERLLAIYQCITSVAEVSMDEEQPGESVSGNEIENGGDNHLMSDVLLQLSSLCNANFIFKGGSCPLEGSTRYRCTVSEELAVKVARSLKFPLVKYLYRR